MNTRYSFRSSVISLLRSFFLLAVIISCGKTPDDKQPREDNCFIYKKEYRALYVNNCDFAAIPDSIISQDISQLAIKSSKPIDFEILSRLIDLNKITYIRIDDLNQSVIDLDLSKFERLRKIGIFGGDSVDKINLINISDSLKHLDLYAGNLEFPPFDSAFMGLISFGYKGRSEVIPQWIEDLNQLQDFDFQSKHITEINCDVCKLKHLSTFSIVDPRVEDKEFFLSKMAVFPIIQRFKACRPDLNFWIVLPPR